MSRTSVLVVVAGSLSKTQTSPALPMMMNFFSPGISSSCSGSRKVRLGNAFWTSHVPAVPGVSVGNTPFRYGSTGTGAVSP